MSKSTGIHISHLAAYVKNIPNPKASSTSMIKSDAKSPIYPHFGGEK
jgi:hypothetical protein